ncbi:cation:dicarboxylase symporter family transporter [Xanthomonadaceae bacterium XH05]|nr:cation:dicarboxylase symporter family transporter [Xanthomonadaceae bacterium XH05]
MSMIAMKIPGATTRVMIGLAAGAVVGLLLAKFSPDAAGLVASIARPIGKLWLAALQMTVVPLVLALVILGVASASDAAASGRVARRALFVFIVLLCGFAAYAAVCAPLLLSLFPHSESLASTLRATMDTPASIAAPGLADWVANVVPSNAIMAAAQGAMLPLVVFALCFGFALTRIAAERRAQLVGLFHGLADTMIVIVHGVLLLAPLGVFALVLVVCVEAGAGVIGALVGYIGLLVALYLGATALCYVVVALGARESPLRFAKAILPAQVVAASTQSSLASLPAMIDCADTRLGYRRSVVALVLPMAVTLFRITSPIQYLAAACFIAWVYGIELSAMQLGTAALLAVAISLGSVGLPGQVSFMATVMPVTQSLGLPLEPLGLLLAVDTIPDVFATTGNVTGDLTATSLIARHENSASSDISPG